MTMIDEGIFPTELNSTHGIWNRGRWRSPSRKDSSHLSCGGMSDVCLSLFKNQVTTDESVVAVFPSDHLTKRDAFLGSRCLGEIN